MKDQPQSHKVARRSLIARIGDYLKAGADARRAHAIAVWGDDAQPQAWEPRPDRLYRAMGAAWGGRR